MLSRYLRIRERGVFVVVFHDLHPDPLYYTKQIWDQFLSGQFGDDHSLVSDLKSKGLVVENDSEDEAEFSATAAALERKLNQPSILYLMTAQGCNFSCGYCPVPGMARRYGDSRLSVEDAFAGIDLWLEHLKESDPDAPYFVIFYGGEPLLNKEAIIASLARLKKLKDEGQLPTKTTFMIATNGLLFDEAMVAICKQYDVVVAVGLDGSKKQNDTLKVDVDGLGTYDHVVAAIRLLVKAGVKTCASATITPYNVDAIDRYSDLFGELGVEKFGFNFLKGHALLELVGQDKLEAFHRMAARGIIANHRRRTTGSFEYQMEKKTEVFARHDYFPVDCTCYGNQLVIQPDGQLSNCPFFKADLGLVRQVSRDFRIFKQTIVAEWRKRLPLYCEDFKSNDAKALCGAGCAWGSSQLKGNPLAVDDSSRIFSEEVFNDLIWSKFQGA
jgi:radical SAM protein with 4Fe4S-binding SPASM domain